MITAEQFERMAESLFMACGAGPRGGPGAWRRVEDRVKDGWREVVERQLRAAGVPFERRDPEGQAW